MKRKHFRTLLHFEALASTNDFAAELARDPGNAGTIVVAATQSAGRGQHGRVWQAPPGSSLLASALLFPPPELQRPVILTALAAVAVAGVIDELTGIDAKIKWPNDLLIDGQKVCGILTECGTLGGRLHAVIGIGLNLNQLPAEFAKLELPLATSLGMCSGRTFAAFEVAALLQQRLDMVYGGLMRGDLASLETEWSRRIGFIGRTATVELLDGGVCTGKVIAVTFDSINVESGVGMMAWAPEMVRHIVAEK